MSIGRLLAVYVLSLVFLTSAVTFAGNGPQQPQVDESLNALVNEAVQGALKTFSDKGLKPEEISVTLIDMSDQKRPKSGSFRGNERVYPASVVKLFYLVALHQQLQDGKVKDTPELRRAMKDMIVDSSNEATQYIVDVITDTTSGPELSPAEMTKWAEKRNAANRYFAGLGFINVNTNQKTFCEDAYGRESVFRGANGENRNKLTTDATARLLMWIAQGEAVNRDRSTQMMELLKRDFSAQSGDADNQARGFTGMALQPGMRLWSKAGWTSQTRHDAAYIELPNGRKFVLVTFTTGHANEREIIPSVARTVIEKFTNSKVARY